MIRNNIDQVSISNELIAGCNSFHNDALYWFKESLATSSIACEQAFFFPKQRTCSQATSSTEKRYA